MPIYVYRCLACGHKMDALQKISAAPLTKCPACEEDKLKKQMTSASFRLKGTGWYETDFKNKGKKEDKSSGKHKNATASKPESEGKSSTKSPKSDNATAVEKSA